MRISAHHSYIKECHGGNTNHSLCKSWSRHSREKRSDIPFYFYSLPTEDSSPRKLHYSEHIGRPVDTCLSKRGMGLVD